MEENGGKSLIRYCIWFVLLLMTIANILKGLRILHLSNSSVYYLYHRIFMSESILVFLSTILFKACNPINLASTDRGEIICVGDQFLLILFKV